MPGGSETTTNGCSFRTQQGAIRCSQPHPGPFSLPAGAEAPTGRTHDPNRCRFKLTSVSAFEHPDLTFADRGPLTGFHRLVAP